MLNDVIVAQAVAHRTRVELDGLVRDDAVRVARECQSAARRRRRAEWQRRLLSLRLGRARSTARPTTTVEPRPAA